MKTLFAVQSKGAKHYAHLVENEGNFELVHNGGAGSRKTLKHGVDMLITEVLYGQMGKQYTIMSDNLPTELSKQVKGALALGSL